MVSILMIEDFYQVQPGGTTFNLTPDDPSAGVWYRLSFQTPRTGPVARC